MGLVLYFGLVDRTRDGRPNAAAPGTGNKARLLAWDDSCFPPEDKDDCAAGMSESTSISSLQGASVSYIPSDSRRSCRSTAASSSPVLNSESPMSSASIKPLLEGVLNDGSPAFLFAPGSSSLVTEIFGTAIKRASSAASTAAAGPLRGLPRLPLGLAASASSRTLSSSAARYSLYSKSSSSRGDT